MRQLDLLEWTPPRKVIPYPQHRRVGRIRDVAIKMLDKPTERAAAFYREQVTDSLFKGLDRAGIDDDEQVLQLMAFWDAVRAEMDRITHQGHGTGGSAA
jgi:hypothetical protein